MKREPVDVTYADLESAYAGPWAVLLKEIYEQWVAGNADKANKVRCGTLYIEEEDDVTVIKIKLRFSL
jgi:hypothetical protein